MSKFADAFLPNRVVDRTTAGLIVVFWVGTGLLVWLLSPFQTLPTPGEILRALGELWWQRGLGPETFSTLRLIAHATWLTVAISLLLSSHLVHLAVEAPSVRLATRLKEGHASITTPRDPAAEKRIQTPLGN